MPSSLKVSCACEARVTTLLSSPEREEHEKERSIADNRLKSLSNMKRHSVIKRWGSRTDKFFPAPW